MGYERRVPQVRAAGGAQQLVEHLVVWQPSVVVGRLALVTLGARGRTAVGRAHAAPHGLGDGPTVSAVVEPPPSSVSSRAVGPAGSRLGPLALARLRVPVAPDDVVPLDRSFATADDGRVPGGPRRRSDDVAGALAAAEGPRARPARARGRTLASRGLRDRRRPRARSRRPSARCTGGPSSTWASRARRAARGGAVLRVRRDAVGPGPVAPGPLWAIRWYVQAEHTREVERFTGFTPLEAADRAEFAAALESWSPDRVSPRERTDPGWPVLGAAGRMGSTVVRAVGEAPDLQGALVALDLRWAATCRPS